MSMYHEVVRVGWRQVSRLFRKCLREQSVSRSMFPRKKWHTGCQWFNENLMIQQAPLKTTRQSCRTTFSLQSTKGMGHWWKHQNFEMSKITYHPAIINEPRQGLLPGSFLQRSAQESQTSNMAMRNQPCTNDVPMYKTSILFWNFFVSHLWFSGGLWSLQLPGQPHPAIAYRAMFPWKMLPTWHRGVHVSSNRWFIACIYICIYEYLTCLVDGWSLGYKTKIYLLGLLGCHHGRYINSYWGKLGGPTELRILEQVQQVKQICAEPNCMNLQKNRK